MTWRVLPPVQHTPTVIKFGSVTTCAPFLVVYNQITYLLSHSTTYNILPHLTNTVLTGVNSVVSLSRGFTTQDHFPKKCSYPSAAP